jgi:phosphoribosyl 1,2-cyclic phosphodiesterase
MTLRVTFWGTRGSIASPGASTVRYGGNTPCVEVRTESGWLVILDAGTGIRALGNHLLVQAKGTLISGDIFLTHAHWDHIQGLPFFAPMFQGGNHFTIWGSASLQTSIDRVVRDQMNPVVFPVAFDELNASIDFRKIHEGDVCTGTGYEVTAMDVQHPGGALAYRFTEPGHSDRSFVYVSDNELQPHHRYETAEGWRAKLVAFARSATVLVHDTTYTTEEYPSHRGWGHSTYRDGVELAIEAGVETLVLFHHEPRRTDDQMDAQVDACRAIVQERGATLRVMAAAEGLTLTV